MSDAPRPAPPAGEEIHLPGPSIIPLLNAAGLSIAIVGAVAGIALVIGGGLVFLVTTAIWIRDSKRELDSLPLEHHSGSPATADGERSKGKTKAKAKAKRAKEDEGGVDTTKGAAQGEAADDAASEDDVPPEVEAVGAGPASQGADGTAGAVPPSKLDK